MAQAVDAPLTSGGEVADPVVSSGYRRYVIFILLLICALNYLDRGVINILAEPVKREFALEDWRLRMLPGFYFAILPRWSRGFSLAFAALYPRNGAFPKSPPVDNA